MIGNCMYLQRDTRPTHTVNIYCNTQNAGSVRGHGVRNEIMNELNLRFYTNHQRTLCRNAFVETDLQFHLTPRLRTLTLPSRFLYQTVL